MTNKISILILLSVLMASHSFAGVASDDLTAAPGKAYTLEEIYQLALRHSEKIKISREDLFIAQQQKKKALSVLIPRVTAFGDYTHYDEEQVVSSSFEIPGFMPMVFESVIQPEWTATWGVKLDQSFTLNGKELIALGMANDNIEKAGHDLYATKETYLFRSALAFYDVLKAKRALEIAIANVKRLEKHKEAVTIRLRVEDVVKTALFRAEAELSKARAEKIAAQNKLRLSHSVLARLVGLEKGFVIKEPDMKRAVIFEDTLDTLIKEGLNERAELKAAKLKKQIAEDQVTYSKSAYWPTVSIEGGWLDRDQDPAGDLEDSLYVGLKINFSLFDGGLRLAQIRESRAQKKQVDLAEEEMKKAIANDVEGAYLELITYKSALTSLGDQKKYAQENFGAVTKLFQHGLANSIDVMDANTLLVTAEKQFSEAIYNCWLAIIKVKRSKGTFLKEVLAKNPTLSQKTINK
jgi:outer membrane protein